ncbi:MAG: hypothetical protein ACK40A_16220, partial [Pannonibacter indicus]
MTVALILKDKTPGVISVRPDDGIETVCQKLADKGIGAVMVGIAVPAETGIAGAGLYILHAMLAMAALYMVAGLIEKRTGSLDTRQMGGLYAASA